MSIYPTVVPTVGQVFNPIDDVDWMNAAAWHAMRDELIAALVEMGALPKGSFANVKTRLEEGGPLSKCRAYRATSNQDIPTGTVVKVQLNAEDYDVQSEFDHVTNYRFTASKAGYYLVNCSIYWAEVTIDKRYYIMLLRNGVEVSRGVINSAVATGFIVNTSDIIYLAADQYLEMNAYHDAGVNREIGLGSYLTFMSIHKLS